MTAAKERRVDSLALTVCQAVEYAMAAGLAVTGLHTVGPGRAVLFGSAVVVGIVAAITHAPLGMLRILGRRGHRIMLMLVSAALVIAAAVTFRWAGLLPAGELVLVGAALMRIRGLTRRERTDRTADADRHQPARRAEAVARTAGNAIGRGVRSGEEHLHRGAYLLGRAIGRRRG